MECPTADALLEDYAKTTLECYEVAETIFEFVGSDDQFEQARLRARQTYAKSEVAHLALETHLERHNCGLSSLETTNP
jgi:hypothetical protein